MVTISDALAIAVQHQRAGRLPEAAEICRRILDVEPEHVGARSLLESIARHRNLQAAQHCLVQGNALAREGKSAEAVACCRQAVELAPDFAPAHNNLSVLLRSQGNWDEAVACGRRALELEPDHAEVHYNLGAALQERGDLDDALACYRKAVELKADFADGHMGLAGIHLLRGDFRQGWLEYEWRWRTKQVPPRPFRQPLWDGGSLAGKTILLYPEQGLGDVIQFIRYAPLVKRLGATVIVECQKPLLPLLATCAGIDRLVGQGDQLPPFATHSPLLSLPRIFQTSLDKMPAAGPYLFAAPALIESWR
jgi:tetratricopeptide (TPR) repeat protein